MATSGQPPGFIGGTNTVVPYPTLQQIADKFRALINDTANNTTGAGTGTGNSAGLIMANSNPDLLTFLSGALTDIFTDLRNVGSPELIIDNYILQGVPVVARQDPTLQVGLSYQGFFDGVIMWPQFTLPIGMQRVLAMWERTSGANEDFIPMRFAQFGLPGVLQGQRMGSWETRQGVVWMPGTTVQTDLRMRCRIGFPDTFNPTNLNFSTTYVPILNCKNAVAAKMLRDYAIRFAPDKYQLAVAEETSQMARLRLESVRQMQAGENQRAAFGEEAVQEFAISWSWL